METIEAHELTLSDTAEAVFTGKTEGNEANHSFSASNRDKLVLSLQSEDILRVERLRNRAEKQSEEVESKVKLLKGDLEQIECLTAALHSAETQLKYMRDYDLQLERKLEQLHLLTAECKNENHVAEAQLDVIQEIGIENETDPLLLMKRFRMAEHRNHKLRWFCEVANELGRGNGKQSHRNSAMQELREYSELSADLERLVASLVEMECDLQQRKEVNEI